MPLRRFVLGLAVSLFCLPSAAWAILIETDSIRVGKTVKVLVGGYFVSGDDKKLTIRVRTADGKSTNKEYDRAKFKIIHQLDGNRLNKLSRDNPKAYRDYAEELAGQKDDPEARDTAMRLHLIAAYLDPQKFGRSSLLGMSALASTPAEARNCRAMAFLLDPKGDARLLKTDAVKPAQLPKTQASALQEFLKALAYYRAGHIELSRNAATREDVDKIFSMAPGMTDQKAFLQRCTDASCATCKGKGKMLNGKKLVECTDCAGAGVNQDVPDDVLRIILRAELWAIDQLSGGDAGDNKEPGATNWASILEARQVSPVAPLSLETITEFDPRKWLYRNGVWVAPP